MTLCRNHQLPLSLKSVVTTANRGELTELALLGARLGAAEHGFLYPFPTPNFHQRAGFCPLPRRWRRRSGGFRITSWGSPGTESRWRGTPWTGSVFNCGHLVDYLNVDYQGNLIFCCTLSHMTVGDGIPTSFGRELVADLKEVSLKEAIVRQFRKAAEVMEARLNGGGNPKGLSETPCLWCLKYFGKLDWLKDFPDSPWTDWLMDENGRNQNHS